MSAQEISMDAVRTDLWRKICDFQIDDSDSSLTFTERLARDNRWTLDYARRVVEEYKRFVYLAMVAGHEVTPSEDVDEAWHLHLIYTRSYWDGLCRTVLERRLHHVPTRGGPQERARHAAQYLQTLETYANHFGALPPSDIWPTQAKSARRGFATMRRRVPMVIGALALPVFLGVANPLDFTGKEFLGFYAVIGLFAVGAAAVIRTFLREDAPTTDSRELTPTEIACLSRGTAGALRACLASLLVEKRLKFDTLNQQPKRWWSKREPLKLIAADNPPTKLSPIEMAIVGWVNEVGSATIKEALESGLPAAEGVRDSLAERGLIETADTFRAARWWPLLPLAVVFLLGVAKVLVGIGRDKPVGFLVAGVSVIFLLRPLRTKQGNKKLAELKSRHQALKNQTFAAAAALPTTTFDFGNDLLLAAGLFGLGTIVLPEVALLRQHLKPVDSGGFYSSGAGCGGGHGGGGSGCGGGGGGGCGGGGCGGCGGG
jgi:uncharacterized protein (TIGR04222 family)